MPPYHVSLIPLKPVEHLVFWPSTLIEIEVNLFLSIEQPGIVILLLLLKVGDRLPDKLIAALWNQGSHTITLKKTTLLDM